MRPEAGTPAAEWIAIDSIAPWKANPRRNESAVEPVARSIARFGFGTPVLVRREDRELIAGHTRIEALKWLAGKVFDGGRWRKRRASEVFVLDGAPGPGFVPARMLDLSPAEAHALALADNKLGELAEWDDEKLSAALAELSGYGTSLDDLGWSGDDLGDLLRLPIPPPGPLGSPAERHSGTPVYAVIVEFGSEREQALAYEDAKSKYPGATIRTVVA